MPTGSSSATGSNAGSVIEGNLFCTNKTGAVALGAGSGILIEQTRKRGNLTVGGLTAAAANGFACRGFDVRVTPLA